MSMVIYWLDSGGAPHCESLGDSELSTALKLSASKRAEGNSHVCIAPSETNLVGKLGVSSVIDGKTPDGHSYEWSKQGRAGAMRRK
jgi:hypothetical protein